MELNILEETKDKIKVEVKGESHTLCNALRKKLWEDSHVKVSGYNLKHSLISEPTLIIETDGGETPKQALRKAISGLKKDLADFKSKFKISK